MGKWDKYKKNKNNENKQNNNGLPAVSINWLITIYPIPLENLVNIRVCEI